MGFKKTRRRRLRKQTRRKKIGSKKGGAKIGEGRTSHVFQPPLKCTDVTNSKYNSDNYVSKLTDSNTAKKEMNIANKLKEIDPDCEYTIYPLISCPINVKQTNTNFIPSIHLKQLGRNLDTLLISIYGGITLITITTYIEENYKENQDSLPPIEYINNVWESMSKLSDFIPVLYENGILHNDITIENMVYNQDDYKTRIIDFEFNNGSSNASKSEDIYYFINSWIYIYDIFVLYYKPSETHNCILEQNRFTLDYYKECCEKLKHIRFALP